MRLAFAGLLLGTLALACSDSDTVVALNVCTRASVDPEAIDSLEVRMMGAANTTLQLEAVSVLACGAKPAYFKRIVLADQTEKGTATIDVRALDVSGNLVETGMTSVIVRPEEVAAAFVELGNDMPPPPGTGGAGGAGGEGGAAGAAGAGN